jgi:hypothetical protein
MDDVEKSKVRLRHWIDHNLDHIKGYEEVAQVLAEKGFSDAAEIVLSGARAIETANEEFEKALESLGGGTEAVSRDPGRSESHHHGHGHNH